MEMPLLKRSVQPKGRTTDKAVAAPHEYVTYFEERNIVLGTRLGSGASGNVYRATQTRLRRDIAIKFFDHPKSRSDAASRTRFEHEAKLLAIAQHPSIPFVLSAGSMPMNNELPIPYIIMQFIDGGGLDTVIKKGPSTPQAAAAHMKQVLAALSCAHRHGIVHRDVKPENILLSTQGHCYLIDFSIGVSLKPVQGLTRITGDRRTPGTVEYSSPEQLAGGDVNERSDLFSAGLVLFELLAGRRVTKPELTDADLSQLPPAARDLLRRACHRSPDKRFQTANEFLGELMRLEMPGINRSEPRDALCLNIACPGTRWTKGGYYVGPFVLNGTTKNFCKRCSSSLAYPCENCGADFNHAQYCEDCGNQHYFAHVCEKCGNSITQRDASRNTAVDGCSRCPTDDDIPF